MRPSQISNQSMGEGFPRLLQGGVDTGSPRLSHGVDGVLVLWEDAGQVDGPLSSHGAAGN